MNPRRRCATLLALTLLAGPVAGCGGSRSGPAGHQPAAGRATVERRELSASVLQAGILTYRAGPGGAPVGLINQARGIYTRLPVAGQVIKPGQELYRVGDVPVLVLRGATPAYRPLAPGAVGPDVVELNRDLVALRLASPAELGPAADTYSAATVGAVQRLQARRGLPQTGQLAFGSIVFAPGAVRVSAITVPLGGAARPGQPVLQITTTDRQVQLALPVSGQARVRRGDRVQITLPDGRVVPGTVASVGSVASCTPAGSASGASGGGCAAGGAAAPPTVAVAVALAHRVGNVVWDRAPVQVAVTTARLRGALVVPVTALLAQAGGRYAVAVVGPGARTRLVAVTPGLFDDADGLVQVVASTLAPGDQVVVPAS